ncbi:MAG: stage III sporulation protein SpoIIIAB [Caulobacteraceae bacterium]
MFFKILGGIMIIAASGLMGILFSNRLSFRLRELKRFRSLMQMLETEVVYSATPLPAAFKEIACRSEGLLAYFFGFISDSLNKRVFFTLKDAWANAVSEVLKDSSLNNQDLDLIKSFGSVLGCSDREDQKKHFELFYIQLRHHEESADAELKRSSKMYRSLGFLLGIAVFVVLF